MRNLCLLSYVMHPFSQNTRNPNHAWCSEHRWEREKYKIKSYKELLPFWCLKCRDIHGYLKTHQVYVNPANKSKICIQCKDKVPYCPIKQKKYADRYTDYRKNWRLNQRYGINSNKYQELLQKQNHCCAICSISITEHQERKGAKKHFAVDHCHDTNKVRGLLCCKCNMGLGYFNDDPEKLTQAINYLTISV